jgi:hypothetical protein
MTDLPAVDTRRLLVEMRRAIDRNGEILSDQLDGHWDTIQYSAPLRLCTLTAGSSVRSLPDPTRTLRPPDRHRSDAREQPLDTKRLRSALVLPRDQHAQIDGPPLVARAAPC